ncbi:MAG: glycosyltransferase [Bacteroidia bacterium]|nr:glycosyltransferase [Bacteroidia bacterium]
MAFFSVITVCKDNARTILSNLQSVQSQTFPDFEHIIQDGLSSDNTAHEVSKVAYAGIKFFSESDNGIYDALNKALARANGTYVIFLHADDFFPDNRILEKIHQFLMNHNMPELVYGDLNYVDADDVRKVIRAWRSGPFRKDAFYDGWMPPHPALVVKKSVFDECGNFQTSFKISGDYEWMVRVFVKYQKCAVYFPEVVVHMRTGGISNRSFWHRCRAWKEDILAWKTNGLKRKWYTLPQKKFRKIFQYFSHEQH